MLSDHVSCIRFHLQLAEKNGINGKEIISLITQMAIFVGWPKAAGALNVIMSEK
ncbi:carboxymuconolactone decarboxylase family protein [Lysinibacillus sp. Ag94]|uniref:carboxymuconolactone decarboxylase family protein n=1 Tax=Lysinibacillus sp. Ag94 TaxID=2936682 RepID=UPI0021118DB4|nr:carboxymuconolactone decarboxylase family protein [Lysinibacillus sp. Ag94]